MGVYILLLPLIWSVVGLAKSLQLSSLLFCVGCCESCVASSYWVLQFGASLVSCGFEFLFLVGFYG